MTFPARPSPSAAAHVTLWTLRLTTALQAGLLVAQPVLAGRFLDGDYPALHQHYLVGTGLMGASMLTLIATVLAWRPGRLPLWPVGVALVMAMLMPMQLGMGHARFVAIHLTLGVALVAAGVALAAWAWRPARAARSHRPRAPRPVQVSR